VFTARYGLISYIKQIPVIFKGLTAPNYTKENHAFLGINYPRWT